MLTRRFTVADENIRVGPGGPVGFLMSDRSQLVSTCLQNHGRAERSGRFFQTPLGPNFRQSMLGLASHHQSLANARARRIQRD